MADVPAPAREYTEPVYRKVAAYLAERGLGADTAVAGCARCQACSSLNLVQHADEKPLLQIGMRG